MKHLWKLVLALPACWLCACGGGAELAGPPSAEVQVPPAVQLAQLPALPLTADSRTVQSSCQHTFAAPDMLAETGADFTDTLLQLDSAGLSFAVLGIDVAAGQRPYKLLLEGSADGVYLAVGDYGSRSWRWLGDARSGDGAVSLPELELVSGDGLFCVALVCAEGDAAALETTVFLSDEAPCDGVWNLMIWMAGDNHLAEQAYQNIQELEAVGSTDSVNVLLGYDINPAWLADQYAGVTQVHFIKVVQDSNPDAINTGGHSANVHLNREGFNSADPLQLAAFLDWAAANFPAEHTALVMYGPGDGWRALCGS